MGFLSVFVLLACVLITLSGGWLAKKCLNSNFKYPIIAASAGMLLGLVFFDLLPEAVELGAALTVHSIFGAAVAGFLVFNLLHLFFGTHSCHRDGHQAHKHSLKGSILGPIALCLHSYMDGVIMGVALLALGNVGLAIIIGVLSHRFVDGINVMVSQQMCDIDVKPQRLPLYLNALAPILGMATSFLFNIPMAWTPVLLAFFAGFFLYLSATDLLPACQHNQHSGKMLACTILGCAIMAIIVLL
jgi:zinc transporter, ZIP family